MAESEEVFGDGFYYWGNEGGDQTQTVLMLSEQIADLQAMVEEQAAVIDELAENVVYKKGAAMPVTGGRGGMRMSRISRLPTMRPEAIAKMGARMGARAALKELGISAPYVGLIIAVAFQAYEGIMKEIAYRAAMDALKEHERKDVEERRKIYAEALEAVEKERRELYRSVVP